MTRRAGMLWAGRPLWGAVAVALAALLAGTGSTLAGGDASFASLMASLSASIVAFVLFFAAQKEVREGERMRLVADSCAGVEACFLPDGRLEWISQSIASLTGYSAQTCMSVPDVLALLVHELDLAECRRLAARALEGEAGSNFEVRIRRHDGEEVWVAFHWRPVLDDLGRVSMIRVSGENIQARKRAELKLLETVAALRRAQGLSDHYLSRSQDERLRLQALLDVIDVGILFVDADRRVRYANPTMLRMWQLGEGESLLGTRDVRLLAEAVAQVSDADAYRRHVFSVSGRRGRAAPFEFSFRDGRIIREVSAMVQGAGPGRSLGRVWIFEDVTEQRKSSAALVRLAERDPLTNLYNRRRFQEALDLTLAGAERGNTRVGLMMFDLDGFKPLNDRMGHQAGDALLVEVGAAVRRVVRRNEMVFRIGGDEFAILIPQADEAALCELAQRVVSEIGRLETPGGSISASVGIACFPRDAGNPTTLVAAADAAMYQAKSAGKNRWYDCEGRDGEGGGIH